MSIYINKVKVERNGYNYPIDLFQLFVHAYTILLLSNISAISPISLPLFHFVYNIYIVYLNIFKYI